MSRKNYIFPVALIFSTIMVLSVSSHYIIQERVKANRKSSYEDSEEVKAFLLERENNRKAAEISIEESRVIAGNWIKKERSKIGIRFYFRRKVYDLLAAEILTSKDFDELNTYLSKLPATEKQAYAAMTIDRTNITTLDNYDPVIPGLLYPIEMPGTYNNGKDLLITSYFSNKRISPVGSGGIRPHLAVDIINIGNIDYVSRNGELVRGDNNPGMIISVAGGVVKRVEYDHVYGWNVTMEHDKSLIPVQKRKGVEYFDTFYAHMEKNLAVKEGDVLSAGDIIGTLGNSGQSTGPHLHFEVRLVYEGGRVVNINPYPGSEW